MNKVIKSGYAGGYGEVILEQRGTYYYIIFSIGSERGPYTRLEDALREYNRYVV
ncbi:MAG: hypothetical protein IJT70_05730 [Clostridia bacterium]|nr:hypothetical protein [Clostridia bacterium]